MKLTKQGIPDLNQLPVNGRRKSVCRPHLPGPLEVVGTRWSTETGWPTTMLVDVHGCRCLKCGEIVGPTL